MQDQIIKFVEDLKNRRMSLDSLDEASTRQAVIGKLLHLLGWDIFNVDEVIPEYAVGDTKIDYALKTGRYNDKVLIEVKRIREDLERHQEQLLGYCFKEGVGFAVLTNGIVWWFYLPLRQSSWEERRFYVIDVVQQDSKDIASKFIEFLSKDNITNGNAIKSAESMYKGKEKSTILDDALPRAWDKMIVESNGKLMDLLGDVTENICGFRPDGGMIKRFLSDHEYHLKTSDIQPMKSSLNIGITTQQMKNSSDTHATAQPGNGVNTQDKKQSSSTGYSGKSITGFNFIETKYQVDTWKGLLIKIADIMYSKHGKDFNKILNVPGKKHQYFSYDPQQLGLAEKFGDTNIYVDTKLGSNSIVKFCYEVIKLFGYSDSDLIIYTVDKVDLPEVSSNSDASDSFNEAMKIPIFEKLVKEIRGINQSVEMQNPQKSMVSFYEKGHGLVWVDYPKNNKTKVHLRKTDYSAVEMPSENFVSIGWGGYPEFYVNSENDIWRVVRLVKYVLHIN